MSTTAQNTGSEFVDKFDYGKLKDRDYKGDDYQPDAKILNGPLEERKCTDCLFLLVWFAFLIGMGWMTIIGYVQGETGKMLAPIMTGELICGYDEGVTEYPKLYVPDLDNAVNPSITNFFKESVCVKDCPTKSENNTIDCFDPSMCTFEVYETHEVIDYCIPAASALANVYNKGEDGTFSTSNYFVSMYESRWVILTSIGISLVVAFIYLKIMDWCAVAIAWITIAVIEISLVALGYFAWAYHS